MTTAPIGKDAKSTTTMFLFTGKPTTPANAVRISKEQRFFDPSSQQPAGKCYPIPSSFDYRFRPKDGE